MGCLFPLVVVEVAPVVFLRSCVIFSTVKATQTWYFTCSFVVFLFSCFVAG